MKLISIVLLMLSAACAAGQGEIYGKVLDEKKEPILNATIVVLQGGIMKGRNVTDYDGYCVIKPLDPGYFDVLFAVQGYDTFMITKVIVAPGQRTVVGYAASVATGKPGFYTRVYKKPLINEYDRTRLLGECGEGGNLLGTTEISELNLDSLNLAQRQDNQKTSHINKQSRKERRAQKKTLRHK